MWGKQDNISPTWWFPQSRSRPILTTLQWLQILIKHMWHNWRQPSTSWPKPTKYFPTRSKVDQNQQNYGQTYQASNEHQCTSLQIESHQKIENASGNKEEEKVRLDKRMDLDGYFWMHVWKLTNRHRSIFAKKRIIDIGMDTPAWTQWEGWKRTRNAYPGKCDS